VEAKRKCEVRSFEERFGAPPFDVLDARQGYWRLRKRAWLAKGIRSELGRAENLLALSDAARRRAGRKRGGRP